jgi:hypothetical protein
MAIGNITAPISGTIFLRIKWFLLVIRFIRHRLFSETVRETGERSGHLIGAKRSEDRSSPCCDLQGKMTF